MQGQQTPQVTFDEYVGMCGAAKAWGIDRMCGHYRLAPQTWAQIQNAWMPTTSSNAHFAPMVDQEAARLQMGGAPRMVTSLAVDQFASGAAQVGSALNNMFGGAFDNVAKAIAPPAIGSTVMVAWSDGNKYPGTVAQVAPGQYLVTMQNGQQHWIAAQFVTLP